MILSAGFWEIGNMWNSLEKNVCRNTYNVVVIVDLIDSGQMFARVMQNAPVMLRKAVIHAGVCLKEHLSAH